MTTYNRMGEAGLQGVAIIALLMLSQQSFAHEYWLDSTQPTWLVGDTLTMDIRNGENYVGNALPLNPHALVAAGIVSPDTRKPLAGRLGDYPAIQLPLTESGLHLVIVETSDTPLNYEDLPAFEQFLSDHDYLPIKDQHLANGYPQTNIRESYTRFAKSLVTVSNSNDKTDKKLKLDTDQAALDAQGLRYELVALNDPHTNDSLSTRLLLNSTAVAGRQIEWYHRDTSGVVIKNKAKTDHQGEVLIDISEPGEYLLNSVWIKPATIKEAHWQSYWASLTFEKP